MKNFLLFISLVLFSQFISAQNVRLQVRILELEHSGIDDDGIWSGADPRWRITPFKNGSGSGLTSWLFSQENTTGTGWDVSGPTACNGNYCTSIDIASTNSTTFGFNFEGWEDDGCGDDDTYDDDCLFNDDDDHNVCNPLVSSVNFRSVNPCTWTTAISPWCNGKFRFTYEYRWDFAEAPTITAQPTPNTNLCLGNTTTLSVSVNSDSYSHSLGRHYQWQISENTDCSGATGWQDIPGATASTYTPQQISGTRLYRVKISSNCANDFSTNTSVSNCSRVTYNVMNGTSGSGHPYANGDIQPDIVTGICGSTILPGSTHNLNTLQPPAVNAVNNVTYSWSASGGSLSSTSAASTVFTAPNTPGSYSITLNYNTPCGVRSTICSFTVGLPACDFVYIDDATGVDAASNGGPTNPMKTLKYALDNAGVKTQFRIAAGTYSENTIVDINNNVFIDGGWKRTGNTWEKTNSATAANRTVINFNGQGTSGSSIGHVMGLRSISKNNWIIQDLTINTNDATGRTSNGTGKSNYAVYIRNSSNYEIIRCEINSGDATDGSNGVNGNNGGAGTQGTLGGSANCGAGDDSGGDGGSGPSGGAGGYGPGGYGYTGGRGGDGGAGGDDNGSADNECIVDRTHSDRNGARGSRGGNNGGYGGCGGTGSNSDTGDAGQNASGNGANGTDGVDGIHVFSTFFTPDAGGNGTGGRGGKGGGGGGGGSWDDDSAGDDSGAGGSSGGSGGGGGGGASGGKGGGSTFGVYSYNSSGTIAATEINSGTAGTGGNGGTGGAGGAGGAGREGRNACDDSGDGGSGGSGTAGGRGGHGGDGSDGVSYAIYSNNGAPNFINITPAIVVNSSTSGGSVPQGNNSSFEMKAAYNIGCTNSEIYFNKSGGGSWDLPYNQFVLINDINTTSSSFASSNPTITAYYTSTGTYGISRVSGYGARDYFVRITEDRPEPILNVSPSTICVGGSVSLAHTNPNTKELEYKWNVYNTPNATGTPVFSSSLENPIIGPFTTAGTYLIQFQVREECCGWSKYVYTSITVNEDPTAPTILARIPDNDDVCVGQSLTTGSASGATLGVSPYTYEYSSFNDVSNVWTSWSTNIPSVSALENSNIIRARVQEISTLGCDASAAIEVEWTGHKDPIPGAVSRDNPATEVVCEGTAISVNSSGASGGVPGTVSDEIQYYLVTPSGGAAPSASDNGTLYSGTITSSVGDYYFRTRRTSTGLDCNTSTWSNWVKLYTVDPKPIPGTLASDQTLCLNENASSVSLTGNNAGVIRWELANNSTFTAPTVLTSTSTTLPGSDIDLVIGTSLSDRFYIRAVVDNVGCPEEESDSVIVRYNLPDPVVTQDATGECIANFAGTWVNIYDPVTDDLICAINDNGQNLGEVTATVYYNGGNSFDVNTLNGGCGTQAVLNRSFVINSQNPINSAIPVGVRLYFKNNELASLIDNSLETHSTGGSLNFAGNDPNGCQDDDDVRNVNDLVVTQITDLPPGEENGVYNPNVGRFILHTPYHSGTTEAFFGGNYVQFNVSSFSEFWIHGTEHSVPLPVELLSFEAKAVNNQFIQLNWTTATEINNEGFEILRSTDGIHFEKIGFANGHGTSSEMHHYAYQDNDVQEGTYYYKLNQIDFNGESELSEIRSASINGVGDRTFVSEFIPNPATHECELRFTLTKETEANIQIYDVTGKLVISENKFLSSGSNTVRFNTHPLASGTYNAIIILNGNVYSRRLAISGRKD